MSVVPGLFTRTSNDRQEKSMLPIKTENSNFVYLGPSPDIGDLHCERVNEDGGRAVYGVWEPSDEERQAIADGANIKVGVWNMEPIPPLSVNVTTEAKVEPGDNDGMAGTQS